GVKTIDVFVHAEVCLRAFHVTGVQTCDLPILVVADHSKCAINTAFNTGSVIGVSCNLYGAGLMPRHVPSFSWGGPEDFKEFRLDKALKVAEAVLLRRDHRLTDAERQNLAAVFEMTRGEQVVK